MSKKATRVGQRHGTFEVLSETGTDGDQTFWLCLCTVCGTKVVRQNRYFRKDRAVPQGCKSCKGKNHWLYKGYEEMEGTYLQRVKVQAKERGLDFSVSYEELWNRYLEQDRKCYLTNLPLVFGENQTASLDRIDSSTGYLKDNIAWCHKDINKMKRDYSLEYFVELCSLVREPKVPELDNR